ncbi:MAG: nucleotide exchange factor GrpE [Methylophilaceae bacterium]
MADDQNTEEQTPVQTDTNQEKEEMEQTEYSAEIEQSPEEKIAALEVALEEAKAQVLYVKADGENIRRRSIEDIDKARKFALEKFSAELLAVKDSLDAALAVESATVESYKNGVELTAKQLLSVFEKFNIAELNPVEEKFDPNKHQAISTIESDAEPNTVVSVLQKGYTLNERVLRPALVVVSKAK